MRTLLCLACLMAAAACHRKPVAPAQATATEHAGANDGTRTSPHRLAGAGRLPAGHPPVDGATPGGHPPPSVDVSTIKVPRAPGPDGHTVAEVHALRARLKDRPVTVQGVVVKFNPRIMGQNWVHVRDGTGSAAQQDDDLTITTQQTANVGERVRVHGVVRLGKDFGYGYRYPAVLDEATIEPLD